MCASICTIPKTSFAKSQLALLKITASPVRSGVERRERSAIARMKKAIGTTIRFANKEIGVTRWKYQRTSANDPIHAATDTPVPSQSHVKEACIPRRGPRSRLRGRNGSGEVQRCKNLETGSANNMMAPTTAKESWKPAEKSSLVSQQRRKNAPAARLLRTKTLRSKKRPPTRMEAITAARRLGTCNPVMAA